MRVVAGAARGSRLEAPPGRSTRPTGDRVREATFNALGSLGVIVDATVVDLFAGSGALGIEALSRGAAAATFVDNDPRALAVVRRNLDSTRLVDRAVVQRSTAERWTSDGGAADVALLDPPYAYGDEAWARLLEALDADVAVLESNRDVPLPARWQLARAKRYGGTVVAIVERR